MLTYLTTHGGRKGSQHQCVSRWCGWTRTKPHEQNRDPTRPSPGGLSHRRLEVTVPGGWALNSNNQLTDFPPGQPVVTVTPRFCVQRAVRIPRATGKISTATILRLIGRYAVQLSKARTFQGRPCLYVVAIVVIFVVVVVAVASLFLPWLLIMGYLCQTKATCFKRCAHSLFLGCCSCQQHSKCTSGRDMLKQLCVPHVCFEICAHRFQWPVFERK